MSNTNDIASAFKLIETILTEGRDIPLLIQPAHMTFSRIHDVRSNGIFRHEDIVIIAMTYGYAISHPRGEIMIDPQRNLMEGIVNISVSTDAATKENIISALLRLEHECNISFNEGDA